MVTLYELSEKKSKRPHSYWIIETDALTNQEKPKHTSTSELSGNFYRRVFKNDNNLLVKYAVKFSIDLGEAYSKFYEIGFRVSKQLDGKLRDRTFDQYRSLKDAVVAKLVNGLVQKKTEARNAELEEIMRIEEFGGRLPFEDYGRVRNMIENLQQSPFNEHKQEDKLEQRLIDITQDNPNEGLKDNYCKVNPGLRADYLAVVRFSALNGHEYEWMKGDEEKLQSKLKELGLINGRMYLENLLFEFQKDTQNGYTYFKESYHDFDSWTKEQAGIYLRVFSRAQKVGFKLIGDSIAIDAIKLFEYDPELAEGILEEAFKIFKDTGKEIDALIFLRKHKRRH